MKERRKNNFNVPLWVGDENGRVLDTKRSAKFWRRLPGPEREVSCSLCYRHCEIEDGAAGWCQHRANQAGKMQLLDHGVVSSVVRQMRGYQVDPFLTYKPGALSIFLGGVHCTAGCQFCMSKNITWDPEKVEWVDGERRAASGWWYNFRGMLPPPEAIRLAEEWGCSQVEFGINEPTMTWEYTYDVARLAKRAGMDVLIETNGFSTPEAVRKLAPYVDAVDVGIKGSGEEAFYDRWMRSPGAMTAVLDSILEWKRAGVHLTIGDVIAPPHMQDGREGLKAMRRLYAWLVENVGEQALLLITPMMKPGPQNPKAGANFFLPATADSEDPMDYGIRLATAVRVAKEMGLVYAHQKKDTTSFNCHNCGGLLLLLQSPCLGCAPCIMPTDFCPWWTHEQQVTDGRCDHCDSSVPIITLTAEELEATRKHIATRSLEIEQMDMNAADPAWKTISVADVQSR